MLPLSDPAFALYSGRFGEPDPRGARPVGMVDNSPVKTLVHKGLTIEGYSRAAVQTYWRVLEMKLGFDLGGQPWSFMSTPTWFVSHVHLELR